jgi:hypothetical protein
MTILNNPTWKGDLLITIHNPCIMKPHALALALASLTQPIIIMSLHNMHYTQHVLLYTSLSYALHSAAIQHFPQYNHLHSRSHCSGRSSTSLPGNLVVYAPC